MTHLMDIIEKYNDIYLLGAVSKESKKLREIFEEKNIMFKDIFEAGDRIHVENSVNDVLVPGDLLDGILILAPEQRYMEYWLERCKNELTIPYVEGFELIHQNEYEECAAMGNVGMLQRCKSCSISYHSCPNRRKLCGKEKTIAHIAFKAGFICNLKCKYCCEFLPYFNASHRIPFDVEQYKADLCKIAEGCEYIDMLSFSGGDVMLNPKLYELINLATSLENVGDIYILTNGTYVPNSDLLDCLECNKENIHIVINGYEINGAAEKLIAELNNRGVKCRLRPNDGWYDFTNLGERRCNEDELRKLYRGCAFDMNDTLYHIYVDGKITMRCGVANGILHYLNLYEKCKGSYVDIRPICADMLATKLTEIEKKPYVEMCDYCRGCQVENRDLKPAGDQLEK